MFDKEYATYQEYCRDRFMRGFHVIPESLWQALKKEQEKCN